MGIKQAVERIKSFFVSISNTVVETIGKLFNARGKKGIGKKSAGVPTNRSSSFLLRRFKIKTRLIASLTLLLVIVLLVTGISSYRNSTNTIDEKVKAYSLELMKQTSVVLNNQLERTETHFTEIGLSNTVQDALAVKYTDTYEQMQAERSLSDFIVTQFMMNDDVANCTLFFGEDFSRTVSYTSQSMNLDTETIIKNCTDSVTWTYFDIETGSKTEKRLGMMKNIKGLLSGGTIAKMVLIPKTTFLDSSYDKMDIGTDESTQKAFPIIILDNDGTVVSSRNVEEYPIGQTNEITKKLASEISKYTAKTTKSVAQNLVTNVNGESSLVTFSSLKVTNKKWSIVSIVPYSYLNHAADNLKNRIIIIGVVCLVIAIFLCLVIARSVSIPLDKLVLSMKKAKEGDLTSQIRDRGNDEIADVCVNYNEMLMNICELVSQVRRTSQSVVQAAGQIATASEATYTSSEQVATTVEQIAKGATDQATEINESVSTMDVLSGGITHVNDDVAQVIVITNKIGELHGEAYKTLAELNEKSDLVSNTSKKVSVNINELSKSMKEIQKILKIMIGISEQTNLLSLNAAIEAARAGEAGKGFAVVANEVKKLAEQSKEFTSNINSIIASIEKKTNDTVEEVMNSDIVVNEQIEAVKNTEMLFKTVFGSVEEVIKNIERTEKSVEAIVKSKEKVLESMENISAVAEESAATTEEISASTEEQIASAEELSNYAKTLNDLSTALNREIDKFKTE